jgi:fibrillarin-like rRNA methylase
MRIEIKDNELIIKTNVYQAKNGGIFLNLGSEAIKLNKDHAEIFAYDIPDFNKEDFLEFYKINK